MTLTYLFQDAAKRAVEQATIRGSSLPDRIYSKEKFISEFAAVLDHDSKLSPADIDVLLLYLSRDSDAIAYDGQVCEHFFFL